MTTKGTSDKYLLWKWENLLTYLAWQWIFIGVSCRKQCNRAYRNVINITIDQRRVCAGGHDGKAACNGDSGGPLVCKNGSQVNVNKMLAYFVHTVHTYLCIDQTVDDKIKMSKPIELTGVTGIDRHHELRSDMRRWTSDSIHERCLFQRVDLQLGLVVFIHNRVTDHRFDNTILLDGILQNPVANTASLACL